MPQDVKTERWAIAMDDWPSFRIVNARSNTDPHSDESLNGTYPTRLAALEQVIDNFERSRDDLAEQIARAKRMRNRLRRAASGTPTRRAETLGSVGEADGGPTLEEGDAQTLSVKKGR